MKTFLIFIGLQSVSWAIAMSYTVKNLDAPYPQAAYKMAGGAFLAGLLLFFWISPRIEAMSTPLMILALVVLSSAAYYILTVAPIIQDKWHVTMPVIPKSGELLDMMPTQKPTPVPTPGPNLNPAPAPAQMPNQMPARAGVPAAPAGPGAPTGTTR